METSLSIRVASIFVLCVVSLLGITLPLCAPKGSLESSNYLVLQSLATGVMLGLALIHLLPEASEGLGEIFPEYPVSMTLAGVGLMTMLAIEQLVTSYVHSAKVAHSTAVVQLSPQADQNATSTKSIDNDQCSCSGGELYFQADDVEPETSKPLAALTSRTHDHQHHHAAMALSDVLEAKSFRDLVTAYSLEVSTAIHSVIIGIGLGTVSDAKNASVLLAALCFHQFLEGIGLGVVLSASSHAMGSVKMIIFVCVFSFVVPLGVIIGILTASEDQAESSSTQTTVEGVLTSFAAGAMLYSALIELTANTFNKPEIEAQFFLKLQMVTAYVVGFGAMAIIGIWA